MDDELRRKIDDVLGYLYVDQRGNYHQAGIKSEMYEIQDSGWVLATIERLEQFTGAFVAPATGWYSVSFDEDGAVIQWLGPEKNGVDRSLTPPER